MTRIKHAFRIPLDLVLWFVAAIPTDLGIYLRRVAYRFRFKRLGKGVTLHESIQIIHGRNMEIGNHATLRRNCTLYAVNGSIKTGDHISVNSNVHLDAGDGHIVIGNNCLIGQNSVLRAADHTYSNPDIAITLQGHTGGRIVIEDDVWMGANVVVTKGIRIGKGSVIGAQSVVTHDIPPYSIAYGVPARVAGSRKKTEVPA